MAAFLPQPLCQVRKRKEEGVRWRANWEELEKGATRSRTFSSMSHLLCVQMWFSTWGLNVKWVKIADETAEMILFTYWANHQEGSDISHEITSTTFEYKAGAQLWVIPCVFEYELPSVPFTRTALTAETYLEPPERQLDPLDVRQNRAIAFRCTGESLKCCNSEKTSGGEDAAVGARDGHTLKWHETDMERKTCSEEVRREEEGSEVSDVSTIRAHRFVPLRINL